MKTFDHTSRGMKESPTGEWLLREDALRLASTVANLRELVRAKDEALRRVKNWEGEFPPSGLFWDAARAQPMSYAAAFGSNGERDYMRQVASAALALTEQTEGKP